jgi:hypothetical protein
MVPARYNQFAHWSSGHSAGSSPAHAETEDDWFEYRLENDPRFLSRIEMARKSLRAERGGAI